MSKYEDMAEQLRIDEHDLDHEAMAQPQRFNDAAKEATRAESRMEAAKDHLKTVEAQVEIEIRRKGDTGSEKKPTDAHVKALVQVHPRRKEAFDAYLDAKLAASKWDGLKEAFKDRSFMIRELSGMWLAGYFQKTSTDGTRHAVEEAQYAERRKQLADNRRAKTRVRVKE